MLAGQKLSPDQMELKETDRRDFMECMEMFCAPKTCAGSKESQCRCAVGLGKEAADCLNQSLSQRGCQGFPVFQMNRVKLFIMCPGIHPLV